MNDSMPLNGKKILFVGIGFYDYDQSIIFKLSELGASVSYFWSGIYDTKYKILLKFKAIKTALKHLQKLRSLEIDKLQKDNDYVFIIKGENLSQKDIDKLKKHNPRAQFILYFWDDIKRIKNFTLLLENFKNIWSFDSEDCLKYGFRFRPLFYRDGLRPKEKNIFLSSIGWFHSNRIEIFNNISKELKLAKLPHYLKLLYTGKFDLFIKRFVFRTLKTIDDEIITTSPIPYNKIMDIIAHSSYVLDIPHASQNGLTIRTIEALKCGCHILTSNTNIKFYPDIKSEFYTIINTSHDLPIKSLLKKNLPISYIGNRFSLKSFLLEILECDSMILNSKSI